MRRGVDDRVVNRAIAFVLRDLDRHATAEEVARLSGARLAVLPSDVGARKEVGDWFALVDAVITGLLAAVS